MENRYINFRNSFSEDGLGVPVISLYFSFCDKKDITGSFCKNCHNKQLQKDKNGFNLDLNTTIKLLKEKISNMEKLTSKEVGIAFIGGEPLAEINREFMIKISNEFKERFQILYTWRDKAMIDLEWIKNINKIVCGEYLENLKSNNYKLGSINQYIINNKKDIIYKYEG